MSRCRWTTLIGLVLLLGAVSNASAVVVQFDSPAGFGGRETLLESDELGIPASAEIQSGKGVTFSLLEIGTLVHTGFSPTSGSAPNSTYAREFPPRDGPFFVRIWRCCSRSR
jgi:hypothetical protein